MSIIYLIESIRDYDTTYKIGYTRSKNAKNRIKALQTGNDGNLKIVHEFQTKHGIIIEKSLHNFYKHKNIKNEWFNLDIEDITNFINMCQKIEDNITTLKNHGNYKFI